MQPAEKGRHCAACQKTVVDFTMMSDAEVIRHLAHSGPNVCGRLAPDQVNRTLDLRKLLQRNGWSGWRWLLAGLLITSNERDGYRPAGQGAEELSIPRKITNAEDVTMGVVVRPLVVDSASVDTVVKGDVVSEICIPGEIMGEVSMKPIDSIPKPGDSIQGPPPVPRADSIAEPVEDLAFNGGIVIYRKDPIDSVKQFLQDTLTALHILPKRELMIYPNPAVRGSAIRLSWQAEPGTYRVALYSIAGALMQERELDLSSGTQVGTWEIPAGLAAGMYILRVVRPGQAGGYTGKLAVE